MSLTKTTMNTSNTKQTQDHMLDTVTLKLTYPDFRVTSPSLFRPALNIESRPSISSYQFRPNSYTKYVQNPSMQDRQAEIYKPRLTAYQRSPELGKTTYDLHVELSIPKLLFGQSVQELDDNDLPRAVALIHRRLHMMGIETTEDAIRRSVVVKAHFGKNIALPYPITAQDAINELSKADIGRGKDINMRHYGNGGQSLYFYASSYNVIFYDKLRDIATPTNKAVDKDKFKPEKLFLKSLAKDQEQDILRFEVRFTKQQSVDAFISKAVGQKIKGISFEKLFDKSLCQKVLLRTWAEIVGKPGSQLAFKTETSAEEIFAAMIKDLDPKKKIAHSLNKLLIDFGLYTLISQYGIRGTRDKIERNWTPKSWNRLYKRIEKSAVILKGIPTSKTISDIQSALEAFEKYNWRSPVDPL